MGIGVESATYGSDLGTETDICHWLPKFEKRMDEVLTFSTFAEGDGAGQYVNDIIMFKSCYPNSDLGPDTDETGDPYATAKTPANYRSTFNSLKTIFAKYPQNLFIYVTAPPLDPSRTSPDNAARAREFNAWVKVDLLAAYRQESGLNNLLVFDLFDLLADDRNVLKEAYRRGRGDSHPNRQGSLAATNAFVTFLGVNGIPRL
jgi:hypothetical protein